MSHPHLQALADALSADTGVSGMVDSRIYKFRALEQSGPDLRNTEHKSLISCEVKDWEGGRISSDPIFIVDIRSKNGPDHGAEYCSEIVQAIKELLQDGFGQGETAVAVSKISGEVKFDKAIVAYRCCLEVHGHIKVTYTLSLSPSAESPQEAGSKVVWIASASPAEGLQYRFLVNGPGTGDAWRDMTGWSAKNSFSWQTSEQDIGDSTVKVQIRGGRNRAAADAEASADFTLTVPSGGGGGSNQLPVITGLYPSLASPRGIGTALEFICVASDPENDPLLYRFILTGPATDGKPKVARDWSGRNSWSWVPTLADVGENAVEVQVRDTKHAGAGGFDDHAVVSYTISPNTVPAISSVSLEESSPYFVDQKVHLIAHASDAEGDLILYKFFVKRSGANLWEPLTEWQPRNWIEYDLQVLDYNAIDIRCWVRDGKHSGGESYDAQATAAIAVSRASLSSLVPTPASPQLKETTITFLATANKTANIYYRFWLKGPGTANVWRDMSGWKQQNSWEWRTLYCDVGANQVKCQVVDDPENWDDGDTTDRETILDYTIT